MFWRKKNSAAPSIKTASEVFDLACRLGVERRQNVRVKYPNGKLHTLPQIAAGNQPLRVVNISLGGCCLHDPQEYLGPHVGQTAELKLQWPEFSDSLMCKIVARVDHRRHIQFLDFPSIRHSILKTGMEPGVRAQLMRPTTRSVLGPRIHAKELWTSLAGDSIQLFDDVHLAARICLNGNECELFRGAWPTLKSGRTMETFEVEGLLVFLGNVLSPSTALNELLASLEVRYHEWVRG